MKRRNRDGVQNIPDRERVEAVAISRQTRSKMPPTSQGAPPGSYALLIEPTVTRMAGSSGPAAPPRHPVAMRKALIAALKQIKTGKFDADGDEP